MRSATPQNLRSGNARRNSVMNFFTSSRPRRGACSEYCKRMSGVLSSSTTPWFQGLPQNSLNHRATTALFSCSFDMLSSFSLSLCPLCAGDKIVCSLCPPDSSSIACLSFHIGNELVTRVTTITDEECVAEIKQRLVWPGASEAHQLSAIGTDRGPYRWRRIRLVHSTLPLDAVCEHLVSNHPGNRFLSVGRVIPAIQCICGFAKMRRPVSGHSKSGVPCSENATAAPHGSPPGDNHRSFSASSRNSSGTERERPSAEPYSTASHPQRSRILSTARSAVQRAIPLLLPGRRFSSSRPKGSSSCTSQCRSSCDTEIPSNEMVLSCG